MNPYGVDTSDKNIRGPVVSLDVLYDGMPETSGCEKCEEINGDNAVWCCKTQNPSMYYVEFLKVWEEVQDWEDSAKAGVLVRCLVNYLSSEKQKGCVFYDDSCLVYHNRPFACRMYGVVPKENWDKRWEALKTREGEEFDAVPQCNLVSAEKEITAEQEDKWFNHTAKAEARVGVPPPFIELHDAPGGSYRAFHDHILLELFDEDRLKLLTEVKTTKPKKEDIDNMAEVLVEALLGQGVIHGR